MKNNYKIRVPPKGAFTIPTEDDLYINDNEFEFMNRSNEAPTYHNELFLTETSKNEITR